MSQPEKPGQVRRFLGDPLQLRMVGKGNMACRHCNDAVVHLLQQESMQVDKIARHMQRRYLPRAIGQNLVSARKAIEQKRAVGRACALRDDVLAGGEAPFLHDNRSEIPDFILRKNIVAPQV
jgi:hypothetical protein